jgi:cytochrome b561
MVTPSFGGKRVQAQRQFVYRRAVVYTGPARFFHWITAVLLLIIFGLGISMTRWVPDEQKIRVYSWHEWFGITVFALTALRLLWRMTHPAPPIDVPRWEKAAAAVVYVAMYLLLLAQPILGWLTSTSFGFPVVYLGIVPLPAPVSEDRELAERLASIHELVAIALALLFFAHLAGVLYHHLIVRDQVLRRMLPSVGQPPAGTA